MIGLTIFQKGNRILSEKKAAEEKQKIHILRGGSAGCLLADYSYIGNCPYSTLARFMGYSGNASLQQGYFDGGIGNEFIWERNVALALEQTSEFDFSTFRCEEDIPVKFMLDEKYPITGRPDLVLGNEESGVFIPGHGLELKATFGVASGVQRLYGHTPDPKHLCQAGFYMRALDIPWSLVYNVYGTGDLNYFDKKEYNKKKLPLGMVEFLLEWQGNNLYYTDPTGEKIKTVITWEGILDYYRLIVEMFEKHQLPHVSNCSLTAKGDDMPFDLNDYNDFTAMVNINNGWKEFISDCEKRAKADRFIKYSRGKYHVFEIPKLEGALQLAEGVLLTTCHTRAHARKVAYKEI